MIFLPLLLRLIQLLKELQLGPHIVGGLVPLILLTENVKGRKEAQQCPTRETTQTYPNKSQGAPRLLRSVP